MVELQKRRIRWAISLLLVMLYFSGLPAEAQYGGGSNTIDLAETSTYVFLSDQSTVVQTGGIAGVHETYPIEGQFRLNVDFDAGTAWFGQVDANLVDESPFLPTERLGELFNMAELLGAVLDDTTISFTGKAADGSDVLITLTIEDDMAYLVGETSPPPNTADFFLFSLDAVAVAQRKYGSGSGEPNDPYMIYTAEQMNAVGANSNDWGKHFKLMADIDLGGYKGTDFNIIGIDGRNPFTGVFNGSGHTISNFSYTSTDTDYIGLFGYVGGENALIKDLGLIDPNVDAGTGRRVGSLVGYLKDGTITGCYVDGGSVSGTGWYVGGLVGRNYCGTITNCTLSASVSGNDWVGGLVGSNFRGTITGCYVDGGSVSGNWYVGGLVGWNVSTTITGCYVDGGNVSGNEVVGGLVGENNSRITNCYSTGSVSGDIAVGGLVGRNTGTGTITGCYFDGSVSGNERVGGLVGTGGTISNCYATGSVSGETFVGGLAGDTSYSGTITCSYATSRVSGNDYVGGLLGYNWGEVMGSLWDTQTSGQLTSGGGTGKTTAEMQDIDTYLNAGWDFVDEILNGTCDYWQISPGDYPKLRYHAGDSPVMPEGLGTIQEPYLIRDARDLGTVRFKPLAHYRLEASVDLSGITWPMAVIPWFEGTFDGNGYVISNLHIQGVEQLGLFGELVSGAKISNLGLKAVDVNGTGLYVGSLVGSTFRGTITGCYVDGGSVSGNDYVGGLVGSNVSTIITGCYVDVGSVSGNERVGGLMGDNNSAISNCYATASVSGDIEVGGLVGFNRGIITNCYSVVGVTGGENVGGLVGSSRSNYGIGGTIANCYSVGSVTGGTDLGGLLGFNDNSTVDNSFWDTQTSGQSNSAGGTGKTTAEMQTESTFTDAGWDFVAEMENGTDVTWWILEGQDYPRLWWEFIVVDDFEDYNYLDPDDPDSNRIFDTWMDGWDVETNGAEVGYADPNFLAGEHFVETTIVHSGKQSMPYFYYNSGPANYSEATANIANLVIYRDWTKYGATVLSLWFYGGPANAPEPMYVAIANYNGPTAVVYHDNPDAALIETWTEWTIDLTKFSDQGVDLTNVDTISIGFGDKNNPVPGGEGHVFFDDIRLYRPAPEPEPTQ